MTGGDHRERAAKLVCREWGFPRTEWRRLLDTQAVARRALGIALRDFWRTVRREAGL